MFYGETSVFISLNSLFGELLCSLGLLLAQSGARGWGVTT